MRERYNGPYRYEGQTAVHLGRFTEEHPVPSLCHLRLCISEEPQGRAVAIVTERADNQGRSVTNAAAELASKIIADFGLDPTITTFVEHYTQESYSPGDGGEPWETYDLVTFTWDGKAATHPAWRRLQSSELAERGIGETMKTQREE